MLNYLAEKETVKYLSLGVPFTSVFLLTGVTSDPVNVTKMFILSGIAGALTALIAFTSAKYLLGNFKSYIIASSFFVAAMVSCVLFSGSPFSQNFYGIYGRNTGLLTYVALVLVSIGALLVSTEKGFRKILIGFHVTGILNIVYCGWVLAFGDFVGWNNPYKKILGLFGNPDFISAFLGMWITAAFAYLIQNKRINAAKISFLILIPVAFLEILQSKAIQGIIVTALGMAIVVFYFLLCSFKSRVVAFVYGLTLLALGVLAVFGTLQKGPFTFVYKRSVSLRGSYWKAGIDMGINNPATGVGMDAYGDWYRYSRPPIALVDTPGVEILTNVSHNVFIDFFAYGGFPLLLSYLAILLLGGIATIRISLRMKSFDWKFVSLVSVWIGYLAQSIVSINQVGLAIWGWVFTGLLVSYDRYQVFEQVKEKKDSRTAKVAPQKVISPGLLGAIGLIVGLFLGWPALNSDSKWFSATNSRDVKKVESALIPSLVNPSSSFRYIQAVDLLSRSGFSDLALKYGIEAVRYNPNNFESWRQLYFLTTAPKTLKDEALRNMNRLDPLNPDVTKIQ